MKNKVILTHAQVMGLCDTLMESVSAVSNIYMRKCYPVPRGGVPAAYMLAQRCEIVIVDTPEDADFFFDDVIDTGETMQDLCETYPGKPFYALVDKTDPDCPYKDTWVVFPWEGDEVGSIETNITRILSFIGDDPARGGLVETPRRVVKALTHWFKGYNEDPAAVLKVFTDGAENCDEMVIVKDIPFYSKCEHHMADIFGTASIAYIPNGKIVGLSKLSRVLDIFARRLQVQERLTNQVADCLMEHLDPRGVGVVIKARHMCMESRGICQQGHHTITSALRGVMKDQPDTRSEFMTLIK